MWTVFSEWCIWKCCTYSICCPSPPRDSSINVRVWRSWEAVPKSTRVKVAMTDFDAKVHWTWQEKNLVYEFYSDPCRGPAWCSHQCCQSSTLFKTSYYCYYQLLPSAVLLLGSGKFSVMRHLANASLADDPKQEFTTSINLDEDLQLHINSMVPCANFLPILNPSSW